MTTRTVDLGEAQRRLTELVREAMQGVEVVITEQDTPVARLVPVAARRRPRRPGSAEGLLTLADDFDAPLDDFADYR